MTCLNVYGVQYIVIAMISKTSRDGNVNPEQKISFRLMFSHYSVSSSFLFLPQLYSFLAVFRFVFSR